MTSVIGRPVADLPDVDATPTIEMKTITAPIRLPPTRGPEGAGEFAYRDFGHLLGPAVNPPTRKPYKVKYRKVGSFGDRLRNRLIIYPLVPLAILFVLATIHPIMPHMSGHKPLMWARQLTAATNFTQLQGPTWYQAIQFAADLCVVILLCFVILNVITLARAALATRYPIPVKPDGRLKVAFVTAKVPSEPLAMAIETLEAAVHLVYPGRFDVWLLDEGDDPEVKAACRELGVRHFSRKHRGIKKGFLAGQQKYGNYNEFFAAHGSDYDVVVGVDLDHVPFSWMLERMLGYFLDPNVVYVVAPQFYKNRTRIVERTAEAMQFVFHSLLQPAGNRGGCAMLVGTCFAIRTKPLLEQAGGYAESQTEDLATALRLLRHRNPATGKRWKAVYTPECVALGVGPRGYGELFQQQARWAGGTFETLRNTWLLSKCVFRFRPRALLHYGLMESYYPSVALSWLLGMFVTVCYLGFGMNLMHTNQQWWLAGYLDVAALQMLLYWSTRKHNVSPHEPAHSTGLSGMIMSALMAPICARAFVLNGILGVRGKFRVTPKHGDADTSTWWSFRYSLMWLPIPVGSLAYAVANHRAYPMMVAWAGLIITVCVLPCILWQYDKLIAYLGDAKSPESG